MPQPYAEQRMSRAMLGVLAIIALTFVGLGLVVFLVVKGLISLFV